MSRASSILRRPSSRPSRRTASPSLGGGAKAPKIRKLYDYKGRAKRGQILAISSVPLSFWEFGDSYQFRGNYWGKPCRVNGKLQFITMSHSGLQATLLMSGTDSQDLLKWAETSKAGGYPPEVVAHLCPAGCPQHPISTGAFHATEVSIEDTSAVWSGNVGQAAEHPEGAGLGGLEKELRGIAQEAQQPNEGPKPSADLNANSSKEELKTGSRDFRQTPWTQPRPCDQSSKGGGARRKRRRDQRKARSRRVQGGMWKASVQGAVTVEAAHPAGRWIRKIQVTPSAKDTESSS